MNLLLWAIWALAWRPLVWLDGGADSGTMRSYLFVAIVPPAFAYGLTLWIARIIRKFERRRQKNATEAA